MLTVCSCGHAIYAEIGPVVGVRSDWANLRRHRHRAEADAPERTTRRSTS